MTDKFKHLKQLLNDDSESPEDVENFVALDSLLSQMTNPQPNETHKQQLLLRLAQELPSPKSRWQILLESYPVALMISQARIIQHEIWGASALTLVLGVVVTLTGTDINLLSFSALAPVVAAFGVAMIYDSDMQAMLEIEETTLASARLLVLARLTLVFCFDLILAVVGSIVLAVFDSNTSLMSLILAWLAPMTFLSGLAFFLSIIVRDTLLAGGVSLVLWLVNLITRSDFYSHNLLYLLSLPGLSDPLNRPILLSVGALLMIVALWLLGIQERQVRTSL